MMLDVAFDKIIYLANFSTLQFNQIFMYSKVLALDLKASFLLIFQHKNEKRKLYK